MTAAEVRRYFDATELANGLANRLLFVCARRARVLPYGGNLHDGTLNDVVEALCLAKDFTSQERVITWGGDARELWERVYEALSTERAGLLGAVTNRAEAQVLRLALLYAILDCSETIRLPHLEAGLEIWRYCDQSARWVFGDALGDPMADTVMEAIRKAPQGLTLTQLHGVFGRNKPANELHAALGSLEHDGRIRQVSQSSGKGRPATIYVAHEYDRNEGSPEVPEVSSSSSYSSYQHQAGDDESQLLTNKHTSERNEENEESRSASRNHCQEPDAPHRSDTGRKEPSPHDNSPSVARPVGNGSAAPAGTSRDPRRFPSADDWDETI